MEEWREIPEFSLYEASNLGRIRRSKPGKRTRVGRLLKKHLNQSGYAVAGLMRNDRKYEVTIHSIILATFIGKRPTGAVINHRNGSKLDNRLINLEYTTPAENVRHAIKFGLRHGPIGETNRSAKLTGELVREIHRRGTSGESKSKLATEYKIGITAIRDICAQRSWRHLWV